MWSWYLAVQYLQMNVYKETAAVLYYVSAWLLSAIGTLSAVNTVVIYFIYYVYKKLCLRLVGR